jgi:hypothetical protein
MKQNKHSEQIFNEADLVDLIMRGFDPSGFDGMIVDSSVDLETAALMLDNVPKLIAYNDLMDIMPTEEYDRQCQSRWYMSDQYQQMDIAEHVLSYVPQMLNYNDVVKNCCCFKNATCSISCVISNILWM